MKKTILFLLWCLPGYAVLAQSNCENLLVKHDGWKESAQTKWHLAIKSAKNGGALQYYGAFHEDDPAHKQFAEIQSQWQSFKPTVAFFEGQDRGVAESDSVTIVKYGESGYVRFLAKQSGIKALPLEPPLSNLYNYLVSKYPQEQVDVYMLTKEAMRLRTRKDYNKEQLVEGISQMLKMAPKMLNRNLSINSIEELDIAFKKYFGTEMEWWQTPQQWYDPMKSSKETGGEFTNEINTLSSDYRDIYMYQAIAEQMNKGERVFAVVGRNHVPVQAEAIKCATR